MESLEAEFPIDRKACNEILAEQRTASYSSHGVLVIITVIRIPRVSSNTNVNLRNVHNKLDYKLVFVVLQHPGIYGILLPARPALCVISP